MARTGATPTPTARSAAADAVRRIRQRFPPDRTHWPDVTGLDARDAALAGAICRHTMQRWSTLEYLLGRHLRRPMRHLEDHAAAVLMTGAAQLLMLDRIPAHAVVDEAVKLMHTRRKRDLAGLVNAVLRRIAELVGPRRSDRPWSPDPAALPLEGGVLELTRPVLPPIEPLDRHLAAATSHPQRLIAAWIEQHGPEVAMQLALAGLRQPPTIIAVEPGFMPGGDGPPLRPHDQPGFFIWEGEHQALGPFIRSHPRRRVQDPAAAEAAACPLQEPPRTIVDCCAGRGTKARQLATLYPEAAVFATETDPARFGDLEQAAAMHANLEAIDAEALSQRIGRGGADLLLLDVPCSNTAVLARRPEARYRYSDRSVQSLLSLQRCIITAAVPLLRDGGRLIYSTCSLQPQENQQQVAWMIRRFGLLFEAERRLLPAGSDAVYHDGAYYALLRST